MKSRIALRIIAVIVFAVVVQQLIAHYDQWLPHRWHTYTADDGTFSIDLPGKPTVDAIPVPTASGTTRMFNLIAVSPTPNTSYSCAYLELGNISSPDAALASARDGSLQKTQSTLISENRIDVAGYPALEMQANARGNSLLDARIIIVGTRLYMIDGIATVKQDREPRTLQRIMNSFKILRK